MNLTEIVTNEDIQQVLNELHELKSLLVNSKDDKKYLRSADVRKMLHISDSTLQRLRISDALKAKKVNGTWFYRLIDIQKMMEAKNENA